MNDERPSQHPPQPVAKLRDDLRYIAIEGVIGAGKTSLARLLAQQFSAQLVLEEFEQNPFLERFYKDPKRWGFHTQLSFLASRFQQQRVLTKRDLFHQLIISDYIFEKDRIFARLNLEGSEMELYETLFNQMALATPIPDLVVYLQSTPDRLMRNIKHRNRAMESSVDRKYIEALHETYNEFFFRFERCPLLIINAAEIDFVKNAEELEDLVRQIAGLRHPGITYYNPASQGGLF